MILTYSIIFNGLHHLKHHHYAEFILQGGKSVTGVSRQGRSEVVVADHSAGRCCTIFACRRRRVNKAL
jgi:hypothetical protein